MTAVPRRDPTERLANLFDSMSANIRAATGRARLDESNRINLLFGHAIFGILVAPTFALLSLTGMNSPSFVVLREIPGNPWSMSAVIGFAGTVLAVATWHRARPWEYGALVAMVLWYLTVSASLLGAVVLWAAEPGPLDWQHAPGIYPVLVYGHLAYALATHATTIRRKGLRRPPRSPG